MVEVNSVSKHGRYKRIRLKRLCALSNVKVLPRKTAGLTDDQLAVWMNTTDYNVDQYATCTDQTLVFEWPPCKGPNNTGYYYK